jgi:hypothetical protein
MFAVILPPAGIGRLDRREESDPWIAIQPHSGELATHLGAAIGSLL